ncbi:MAG: hypothetical protein ABIW19_14395 [Vicinamibacterales bacterium]
MRRTRGGSCATWELRQKFDRVDGADDLFDSRDDGWEARARVPCKLGKVCSEIDDSLVRHLARQLL